MSEINTYNIGNHDGKITEREAWRAEVERMIRKDENQEYQPDYDAGWNDGLEELLKNMEAKHGKL